ncbi:MAG: hypothetical protein JW791_02365 [Nanoarchaeota archaeon]|nr:hypothetical protein [Nanoarchaeota archaeon]
MGLINYEMSNAKFHLVTYGSDFNYRILGNLYMPRSKYLNNSYSSNLRLY